VKFTALDAAGLGFATCCIDDASRGVNLKPDDVVQAIEQMRAQGIRVIAASGITG